MKLIIIDDDPIVSSALKTIIEAQSHYSVVALGTDGTDALPLFIEYKPDAFVSFSDSIKMNTDLVGSWVKNDLSLLTYVSEDVYLNKNFLIQIKENFLKDEKYHIVYPVILEAIKAYEREDFLHENLNKKDHKIRKNKKKI